MVTPAEKISNFTQMMEEFAHLDYVKLITFLLESSHLARNIATVFFRDAIPLQMTQYYAPENNNAKLLQTFLNKKWVLIPNCTFNRIVVKFVFGKLSKMDSVNAFFFPLEVKIPYLMVQQRYLWNRYTNNTDLTAKFSANGYWYWYWPISIYWYYAFHIMWVIRTK